MYCVNFLLRKNEYIHYLDIPSKKENAPLVILLHGFPDNAFGWDLQIEMLRKSFSVVAPFMPGTLNDNVVDSARIEGRELKEDLKAILKKVRKNSEQKIYIISHDLGCFLSVAVAEELGNEVSGLIHLNGMGLSQFVDRKWSLTQWFKSYYVLLAQSAFVRFVVSKMMPKFFLKTVYNLSRLPSEDVVRLNDKRVFNSIAIYRHLFFSAGKTLHKKMKKLSTPALFVWGNDDAFLNIPTMNEVEKFYERGEVRILQGGHWVMREKSQQVNRILLKTLTSWEQSS